MIKEAIEVEKEYQKDKEKGIINKSLIELLRPLGYDNLQKFFIDKITYEIKQLKIQKYDGDMLGIPEAISNSIENQVPTMFLPYAKKTFLWHGNEKINLDLCNKLDIDVLTLNYFGGNIVSGPDDFSMGLLVPKSVDVTFQYYLERYSQFYRKYFDNVIIDNNDILINDKKVQGSIFFEGNDMYFYGTAISFCDWSNLIKEVCNKQSVKIPGYIDSKILPKSILVKEVESWLQ